VFLGIYGLRVFWDDQDDRWWYLGIALLGMAAGAKEAGLLFPVLGAGLGLWAAFRGRMRLGQLARGCLLAGVVVIPWYAFIGYETGNPLWPMFPGLGRASWDNRPFIARLVEFSSGDTKGLGLTVQLLRVGEGYALTAKQVWDFLVLPVNLVIHPERFVPYDPRDPRPIFLLVAAWPLAWLAALWSRSVRWWVLWGIVFTTFWFLTAQYMRYWVPAIPLVALAIYESLAWLLERVCPVKTLRDAVWACLALFAVFPGASAVLAEMRLKGAPPVQPAAREAFLERVCIGYMGTKYINEHAIAGETVFIMNSDWVAYYFHIPVIDMLSPLRQGDVPAFRWPDDERWVRWLRSLGVSWVFIESAHAPPWLRIPKQNPLLNPYWPNFKLAYQDSTSLVFHYSGQD
jgi:hypothetical protein